MQNEMIKNATLAGIRDGIRIFENKQLIVPDGGPVEVSRSWRERLFTRPWRPWKATRSHQPMKPDPQAYGFKSFGERVIVMHPSMLARLQAELDKQ